MTRTAVGTGSGDNDPDIATLIEMLKGELRATNPEDTEAFNRLFGDLVALEQKRRLG